MGTLFACLALSAALAPAASPDPVRVPADHAAHAEPGRAGGRLVVALRSEPRTLNPVTAQDVASREVLGRLHAPLVQIDRASQATAMGLARSVSVSPDGRRYTVKLRPGLRFSDGQPCLADDVVFSFEAYLDERNGSPQRDLLVIGGQPIRVTKRDAETVVLDLAAPYAAAERLFDGVAILPRHLVKDAQLAGTLGAAWGVATPPSELAGMGPFRLKAYVPGQRIVLERNPYYWKRDAAGRPLPYLDEIVFLLVPNEDAQVIRFQAGETDVISRLSPENFALLARDEERRGYRVQDLGPGLEYTFLFFNLNDPRPGQGTDASRRRSWFREVAFRQAVSRALDRDSLVRLVQLGRAAPLASHVTPGNRGWVNAALRVSPRSVDEARALLASAGFKADEDGTLKAPTGEPVEFSIVTSASNAARVRMATILQEDLRELGMRVNVVPLENRAVLDRVLHSQDYDACVLALGSGDADPNVEMNVWLSSGATHLWHLGQATPATSWEAEIDRLMRLQMTTLEPARRKGLYDRVQALVAENLPIIPLLSPHILVGARKDLGNFRPTILDHYVLWNADELFWKTGSSRLP